MTEGEVQKLLKKADILYIKNIKLKNFRNYESLNLDLKNDINIFIGENAQGKTNLLEAIFFSCIGKSYKTYKDKDLIKWDSEAAYINSIFINKKREEHINIYINKNQGKGIKINELPISKISKLIGLTNIVIFTPEDMSFFKDEPNIRRKYLDIEISQIDSIYIDSIQKYYRAIKQKNSLLKNKNVSRETLDIWNEQIVKYGIEVIKKRQEYIENIKKIIKSIHSKLTEDKEDIEIEYKSNTSVESFKDDILKKQEEERRYMSSLVGPHRDDILFKINNKEIGKCCSQGQNRTAVLSLKLSEIELMKNIANESPILLLDDVLSELDKKRQVNLIESISNIQTILTTTEISNEIRELLNTDNVFYIENGMIN